MAGGWRGIATDGVVAALGTFRRYDDCSLHFVCNCRIAAHTYVVVMHKNYFSFFQGLDTIGSARIELEWSELKSKLPLKKQ